MNSLCFPYNRILSCFKFWDISGQVIEIYLNKKLGIHMSTDYAALTLVVDRSGSMHSIATDVVGSVKQFIGDQKKKEGKAFLTVAQFDHTYEVIHDHKDIQEVDEEKFAKAYSPRGSTALLDAIGRSTLAMKARIDAMTLENRPKRVVIAVITDGYENSSKEYNLTQIQNMIKQHEALGWDFMFLGASLDTIKIAESMGFSACKSAAFDTSCFKNSMQVISNQVTNARVGKALEISQAEREELQKKENNAAV